MIVAVNKMDEKTVNCSKKGHNEIKTETSRFMKLTGFNHDKIPFVLILGFNGDNTIERSEKMPWHKADAP